MTATNRTTYDYPDNGDAFANSCDDENCLCRAEYDYPDNIADGCPYATEPTLAAALKAKFNAR